MKVMACIDSQNNITDEVEIVDHVDYQHVIVEYNGEHYTATYDAFSGIYFVDIAHSVKKGNVLWHH